MEFWVLDQSTNSRHTVVAEGASLVIGHDDGCDIVLKGPFVARRHARLVLKGNQMYVENLARSGTRVANREVIDGQPMKVDFGDEIQIGQFSVAPIRRDTKPGADSGSRFELQKKLVEFEQEVHSDLLARMNLRITAAVNKSDQAYVDQILQHLDEILNRRVSELSADLVRHTVHMHLHRSVMAEVVRQCQGRVQTEYKTDERLLDSNRETQINEIVTSMIDMMPLIFEASSVNEDLAIAEEAFDDLFEQIIGSVNRNVQQYIVRRTVSKDIQDIMFGLGPLQDLLEMANVSEIMVVGKDRIYVEKNGVVQPTTRRFFSDEVLLSVIERILTPVGRRVDHSNPLVDARLPDGSRVNAVISPLSLQGPALTIRKFSWIPFTIDDLIDRQTISQQCAEFLQACVLGRKNIIISGGTGSGKTTLLNVMSAYCRPNERIVTIEESAELRLPQPHVVGLEARPANVEGKGEYNTRVLVRNALRMRPDRIIVGEVRGPEALDMLQAMNTGHDGSLSTLHANAPAEAMQRLETLVLMAVDMPMRAIREQIVSATDVVVQITRLSNGQRRVTHISEVVQIEEDTGNIRLENIFTLRNPDQPRLRHTGYLPSFTQELMQRNRLDVRVFL